MYGFLNLISSFQILANAVSLTLVFLCTCGNCYLLAISESSSDTNNINSAKMQITINEYSNKEKPACEQSKNRLYLE